ncbi:uncharacterized protein LOC128235390 [Mya arenaria]|uniref:uncharacterized protein LOC128235390 n=1 Tax=Mya arenaria TaxID=6604 RepID=UPI0022E711F1|nr:uncharacterized protein LOC128235390 [Mya arenaria]
MMEKLILLTSVVGLTAAAAGVTQQHQVRTTTIGGQIHFFFEPNVRHMVAATDSKCYIVTLTYDEADHVHTSGGLEDLELRMMREWMGTLNETSVYHSDPHLPELVSRWCAHKDIMYLQRPDTAATTVGSPFG